jgi:hypothetical protein
MSLLNLPPRTPIVWSYGLQPDGSWRNNRSYHGIFFADGSMQGFQGNLTSRNTPLKKWGGNEPTVNIAEALPPGAYILIPPSGMVEYAEAIQGRESQIQAIWAYWAWATLPALLMVGVAFFLTHPLRRPSPTLRRLSVVAGTVMAACFWTILLWPWLA